MVEETIEEGYKQTEIGVIPRDWAAKPLDGAIDLLTGYPFPSSKYVSNGVKLLRGSNIKRGKTDWKEEITEYWEKVTFDLQPYVLKDGDIVVAMDGSLVGRSFARLSHSDLPALLLQRVARIRSDKIDMGYLKEYICSYYFTKYCDSVKTVTAIPHISPQDIRKFVIPLPPTKDEQCAISQVLADTDALIGSLDRLIEKKKNIKQGAMQELLHPKDGWEEKTLFELVPNLRMGQSPNSSFYNTDARGLPLIQGNTDIENRKTIIHSYTSQITKCASAGDIILTVRAPVGNVAKATFECCLGRGVCGFSYPNEFLYHWLVSYEPRWGSLSTGSTFDSISGDKLKEVIITLPKDRSEQQQIAAILSDMDAEIDVLTAKLNKAKLKKQGMMEQLLTGKIRLEAKSNA